MGDGIGSKPPSGSLDVVVLRPRYDPLVHSPSSAFPASNPNHFHSAPRAEAIDRSGGIGNVRLSSEPWCINTSL